MARRNGVWYDGTLINTGGQSALKITRTNRRVLELLVAERFSAKNKDAPDDKKDATKGPEDYVTVATAWHRIQVWDTAEGHPDFLALVTDPKFNNGALITVDASYEEETKPWVDKAGQTRVGRREKIFFGVQDGGFVGLKTLDDGRQFPSTESDSQGRNWRIPLWDGASSL